MPRILIADDNSNIQKMVTLALHGAGIEVVSVSNGGAAIRSLPETSPDLVLADVFMPVRSGYEVCEFIKHEPRFSHVPVVLLVGAFDPLDESEAQRVSADGILKKPFIPPEPLIDLVKALLAKSLHERPEPAPVAVGAHATEDRVSQAAGRASDVAAGESEEPGEEFAPAALKPDFGSHEATLAFGSLLEMPVPTSDEVSSQLGKPAPWDKSNAEELEVAPNAASNLQDRLWGHPAEPAVADEEADSLRPRGEHDFAGADIPELEVIPPGETKVNALSNVPAPTEGNAPPVPELSLEDFTMSSVADLAFKSEAEPEPVSEADAEADQASPYDFSSTLGADQLETDREESAAEPFAELPEIEPRAWESAAAEPANVEPLADVAGPPPELVRNEAIGASEPEVIEQALAEPAAVESNDKELPNLAGDSLKTSALWAGPKVPVFPGSEKLWISHAETKEAATEGENKHGAEMHADVESSAAAADALGLAEIAFVEGKPTAAAVGAQPDHSGKSDIEAVQSRDSSPVADPLRQDAELIEAIVTRIVDRMQPKVIDVVTREILRPIVEALVRREINKEN